MNIYLDRFDQEMRRRGIRIVRYADDLLLFAETHSKAAEYGRIATGILENDLRLRVNREKTHQTSAWKGAPYLGFIIRERTVSIHPDKVNSFKERVREMTPRNHGLNVAGLVKVLNRYLRGWANYFRVANCKKVFGELAEWIRRRVRMKKMREWKVWKKLHKALRGRGYKGAYKKISMKRWRNSASPLVNMALPNSWFDELGLIDLGAYKVGILSQYYEV